MASADAMKREASGKGGLETESQISPRGSALPEKTWSALQKANREFNLDLEDHKCSRSPLAPMGRREEKRCLRRCHGLTRVCFTMARPVGNTAFPKGRGLAGQDRVQDPQPNRLVFGFNSKEEVKYHSEQGPNIMHLTNMAE